LTLNKERLTGYRFSVDAALQDLIGVDDSRGSSFVGYDLYVQLTRRIFLLMPFYPLLVMGKWIGIGPAIYRQVAKYRTRIFGVCTRGAVVTRVITDVGKPDRPLVLRAIIAAYLISCVLFVSFRAPLLKHEFGIPIFYQFDVTGLFGLTPISVFNQDAMPLHQNFFTVSAVSSDGTKQLLPFAGEAGEYLTWQNWSDRAFYHDGLRWRIDLFFSKKEPSCFDEARDHKVLANVFTYAQRHYSDIDHFVVNYYHEPVVTGAQWAQRQPLTYHPKLICSIALAPNVRPKL
jgi:hypothetical protein